ncbi:hypothetical protein DFH09DRAFT_1353709 [Mycena vulgaris]|nr:hypothetical protein DFH09DRAFT_1353709 [Mycena vulgaris]
MSTGTISLQVALGYIEDIEETSRIPHPTALAQLYSKGQVQHRLTRILSHLPAAPAATASRQRPDRASSEPPYLAQPTPRSPPKTKPTTKEAKTLRCRKYACEILTNSLQDDLLTADNLFSILMKPFRGNNSWRVARGAVDFASILLQVCLKQELQYAKIDDMTQHLLLHHHNLGCQETTSDISNFLGALFQTVNAIEFSVEAKKLGAGSGGKTALYQSMYDAEITVQCDGTHVGVKFVPVSGFELPAEVQEQASSALEELFSEWALLAGEDLEDDEDSEHAQDDEEDDDSDDEEAPEREQEQDVAMGAPEEQALQHEELPMGRDARYEVVWQNILWTKQCPQGSVKPAGDTTPYAIIV